METSILTDLQVPVPVFINNAETKFCLKSCVLVSSRRPFLISNYLALHKIVETKLCL